MARDDFTKPIKVLAYQRVAGRCSNPTCRASTFAPSGKVEVSNVGVGAHIHAASPGGPRYLAAMTTQQRRGFENIIWLCQTCSTIIDRDANAYPAEMLQKWKTSAETRALLEQGKRPPDEADVYRMAAMAMGNKVTGFYPQAIENVHGAVVHQLQAVDPRFNISTSYADGKTSITIGAKQHVAIAIKVGSESMSAWRKGLQIAFDQGCAATLPLDGVVFEGSDLFSVLSPGGDSGSITIIPPSRPAVLKIIAHEGQPPIFEVITGNVTAGRKQIKFSGRGYGGLLEVEVIFSRRGEDDVQAASNLTTHVAAWDGKDARNPPYLEAYINFLATALDSSASISFVLEIEGNQLASGNIHSPKQLEWIKDALSFANYVKRAKNVLQYLGKTMSINVSAGFTVEEHQALARISDIVDGKLVYARSEIAGRPEMTLVCTDNGKMLLEMVDKEGFSVLQHKEPASLINIYGKEYKVPPTTTFYSPVKLHILSRKKRKNSVVFKVQMEMAENFTSQTLFDLDAGPPQSSDDVPSPPLPR